MREQKQVQTLEIPTVENGRAWIAWLSVIKWKEGNLDNVQVSLGNCVEIGQFYSNRECKCGHRLKE